MVLVSIVIVNWNGEKILPQCLKSLLALNHKNIEIIVVDNGSTDNSVNIIREICADAKIIELEKNIGFAAGMNVGFERSSGEFIATLNNDMTVEPNWLSQPIDFLQNDKTVGIVSCRQMNYYDRTVIDGLYHYITKELVLMPFGYYEKFRGDKMFSQPGFVMSANGGSLVVRKETIAQIGGYDADFFGYMEETDFCMRAFLNNWRCVYAPNAVIYHIDGFSFKKNKGEYRYYLRERNRIWFLYKNIPTADILLRLPFILFMELRVIRIFFLKIMKPSFYFKARLEALHGLKRYKEIRKENIKLFIKKRKEFYKFEKLKKIDF